MSITGEVRQAPSELRDGANLRLNDSVRVVGVNEVEDLAEAITDPERAGLALVAGTDTQLPFDAFVSEVARWTKATVGQAEIVVMDPPATAAFSQIMGPAHAVRPWTLRTYVRDVDPAVESDGLRHRFLTTRRLVEAPRQDIIKLLARVARRHAADTALPESVARIGRLLARVENNYVLAGVSPAIEAPAVAPEALPKAMSADPTQLDGHQATQPDPGTDETVAADSSSTTPSVGEEAENYLAQLDLVKRVLGVKSLDEPTLRELARRSGQAPDALSIDRVTRQLREKQEHIEQLEADLAETRKALEDEQYEHAVVELAASEATDEIRWLRERLKKAQDWEGATAPLPPSALTAHPGSFVDLLEQLSEIAELGVVFTGSAKISRDLDSYDSLGKAVRTTWEALLALVDYVRARRAGSWDSGGVDEYLHRTPDGFRGISPAKHAQTETAETMRQFGAERIFPVPPECSPMGQVAMPAHFKLGRIGMVSPRMHYHDDTAGTGLVYVGYIGPHLRNTKTN